MNIQIKNQIEKIDFNYEKLVNVEIKRLALIISNFIIENELKTDDCLKELYEEVKNDYEFIPKFWNKIEFLVHMNTNS